MIQRLVFSTISRMDFFGWTALSDQGIYVCGQ